MVTSLPSISLSLSLCISLSLSHRAHLTHNIGSASALPIIGTGSSLWSRSSPQTFWIENCHHILQNYLWHSKATAIIIGWQNKWSHGLQHWSAGDHRRPGRSTTMVLLLCCNKKKITIWLVDLYSSRLTQIDSPCGFISFGVQSTLNVCCIYVLWCSEIPADMDNRASSMVEGKDSVFDLFIYSNGQCVLLGHRLYALWRFLHGQWWGWSISECSTHALNSMRKWADNHYCLSAFKSMMLRQDPNPLDLSF